MRTAWPFRPPAALLLASVVIGLVLRVLGPGVKSPIADLFLETAYAPFFAVRAWAVDLLTVREANVRLRRALAEASWEVQRRAEAARELERLRVLLKQDRGPEHRLLIGRVVGWERRGGRNEVIVDRGRAAGLARFAPAVTEGGVAGKVRDVMEDYARVQLITDPACRVAVRDRRSGVLGVVRWTPQGVLVMDHVGLGADVEINDTLVTAGHGGIFPPGLLVGTVKLVGKEDPSLVQYIEVQPAVRFDRLDYLFFLQPTGPRPTGAPYATDEARP